MTDDGLATGQWGADQRLFGDPVGARSEMLRIGWEPGFGGYLEERVRYLVNQIYGEYPYRHFIEASVDYSHPWKDLNVGGEVLAGRDVFGKPFSRLSAFVRYGGDAHTPDYESVDDSNSSPSRAAPPKRRPKESFSSMRASMQTGSAWISKKAIRSPPRI